LRRALGEGRGEGSGSRSEDWGLRGVAGNGVLGFASIMRDIMEWISKSLALMEVRSVWWFEKKSSGWEATCS
jgi:hypothetical protein